MSTNERTADVAATTTTANEKLPTAISDTDTTELRYFKHRAVRRVSGICYCLCGHTRNLEEAKRIKSRLGAAWETTPKCPDCEMLHQLDRQMRAETQRVRELTDALTVIRKYLGGGDQ